MITLEDYLKLIGREGELRTINSSTCSYKVQVMRLNYVTDEQLKCKNCSGEYFEQCDYYKPLRNTAIRFSHLRLYK